MGKYTLLHRLGEGGMGVVHLAQGPDGRRVALKVLRPHVVGDEEARDRLAREVSSLSRVRSSRVAEIIDADPWGPVPFVATRYVPGLSLHDHVPQEGPLAGDDLVHFARSLAESLQAVHRVGVLHRDVKPSNVLMEGRTPVLIDFGLARVAEDDRITRTGWLLGTPGYLAPEVLYGEEPTPAADVHAWAATVAFAGTGRPPFGRGPSVAVMDRVRRGEHDVSGLGPEVRGLVEAALAPEPTARPSLATLVDALGGTSTQERLLPAPEPTRLAPAAPPAREPYRQPPPVPAPVPESAPVRVGAAERARRWVLGLALLAVVAAGVAAAPWLTAGALAVSVAVLRWLSVIASSAAARRTLRGRRWYDAPLTLASTPVDLVASIPGTVLLLGLAGCLVASGALLCLAFGVLPQQGLPALGALLGVLLWVGPGGRRVRGPVRRIGAPVARVPWAWLVALACLGVLAGALAWSGLSAGPSWSPAEGEPWRMGTWLSRHV